MNTLLRVGMVALLGLLGVEVWCGKPFAVLSVAVAILCLAKSLKPETGGQS